MITADSVDMKRQLEVDKSWLQTLGDGSQLNRQKFPVLVHAISIKDFNTKNQEQEIKCVYDNDSWL